MIEETKLNDSSIIESCIVDDLDIDSLCEKIINKEIYIKNLNTNTKPTFNYVNTDSITKLHSYYNLIEFEFDEVDIIIKKIKELVFKINGWESFYLKMWANIYREGDYIGYHTHLPDLPNVKKMSTALSGHCFLYSNKPTYTTYYFKQQNIKRSILGNGSLEKTDILNIPGEISIFSSYVPHEFKKWDGNLRIGIAFDINHNTMSKIEDLKEKIYQVTVNNPINTDNTIVTNVRHLQSLQQIKKSIAEILQGLDNQLPGDLLAIVIRTCLFHLGEITGEITNEDKLDYIFSKFCIGK
jgi:hypothetical protein